MTVHNAPLSYLSLSLKDTYMWKQTQEGPALQKAALKLACIVAVPLELIARCFYNIGVWMYNALCHRSIQPVDVRRPQLDDSVAKAIAAAQATIPAEPDPSHKFVIQERIGGTLFGQAVGDGLGLFTEFLTRAQAQQLKRENLGFAHRNDFEAPNPHVTKFPKNGWTDDTDQAIEIVYATEAHRLDASKPEEVRMAEQLYNWYQHGLNGFSGVEGVDFPSRQDSTSDDPNRKQIGCRGLGALTANVITRNTFMNDPHATAKEAWKEGNRPIRDRPAANGAVMRTGALGAMYHPDLAQAVREAILYAKVTHADPRCIASAVAATVAIALLFWTDDVEKALFHAEEIAVCVLQDEMKKVYEDINARDREDWETIVQDFEKELRACMHADLGALHLDERGKIGYTFKTLGAGCYALRRAGILANDPGFDKNIFSTVIEEIIWEGGDADTNAAVAGALVGTFRNRNGILNRLDLHPQDFKVLLNAMDICDKVAQRVLQK